MGGVTKIQPIVYQAKSPAKYEVKGSTGGYTIFVPAQNIDAGHWEYKGGGSLRHLGFMPAFEPSETSGELVHTRFYHVYLPSYIVSFVAAVLLACYHFWPFARRARS